MRQFISVYILLIAVLLVGCTSKSETGEQQAEQTTVTFWFDYTNLQRKQIWESIIRDFEQAYPAIHIAYEALPKDAAKAKFDAAIATNTAPDIASLYTSWIPEYVFRDALLPLDDIVEGWKEINKINERELDFNRTIVHDHKLYSIPYTQNLDVLWVRQDWIDNKQLSVPTTWSEFFSLTTLLTDAQHSKFGYSIRGGIGSSFQLQRMMYSYSGISQYIVDGKSTINDPMHVEFMKQYVALYDRVTPMSDITNDYNTLLLKFHENEVGMIQHNLGSYADHRLALNDDQFTAVAIPPTLDGRYVVEGGNTMGISIFKKSEQPKEAAIFLKYLTSAHVQSKWNEAVGQIPTHQDVLDEEWVHEAPHLQLALSIYQNPSTITYNPPFELTDYNTIRKTIVEPGIQNVLSGQQTVEAFLDEWARVIEQHAAYYEKMLEKIEK